MDKQALPITNQNASQMKSYEYDPQRKDEREYHREKQKQYENPKRGGNQPSSDYQMMKDCLEFGVKFI